jgi:thiaminase
MATSVRRLVTAYPDEWDLAVKHQFLKNCAEGTISKI